jgi:hypothetical protein
MSRIAREYPDQPELWTAPAPPWPDDDEGTRGNDPEGPTTVPPSTLSGPYWDDRPMSPAPALNGEEEVERARIRRQAQTIVANWRVNFDADDDFPLVNMIDAALLAARRPATEAEGAIERVKALAEELDEDSANADPTSFVAKGWRDAARRIRATLTPAADGGDPP